MPPRIVIIGGIGAALVVVLVVVLQATCATESGEAGEGTPTPIGSALFGEPTVTARSMTPTTKLMARSDEEALNLVWSFLGRCISLSPADLEAHAAGGDLFVKGSAGAASSQYGFWRVDASTGVMHPEDPLARELSTFIESECSENRRPEALLPTPTVTPVPEPSPSPTPEATPSVKSSDEARHLLWAYLGLCFPFDPSQLESVLVERSWFVNATPSSPDNFGLWKVDTLTGRLEPHDLLARRWESAVQSQCSQEELGIL